MRIRILSQTVTDKETLGFSKLEADLKKILDEQPGSSIKWLQSSAGAGEGFTTLINTTLTAVVSSQS